MFIDNMKKMDCETYILLSKRERHKNMKERHERKNVLSFLQYNVFLYHFLAKNDRTYKCHKWWNFSMFLMNTNHE